MCKTPCVLGWYKVRLSVSIRPVPVRLLLTHSIALLLAVESLVPRAIAVLDSPTLGCRRVPNRSFDRKLHTPQLGTTTERCKSCRHRILSPARTACNAGYERIYLSRKFWTPSALKCATLEHSRLDPGTFHKRVRNQSRGFVNCLPIASNCAQCESVSRAFPKGNTASRLLGRRRLTQMTRWRFRYIVHAHHPAPRCYVLTLTLERLLAHVARAGEAMGRPGAIPRSDGHITTRGEALGPARPSSKLFRKSARDA